MTTTDDAWLLDAVVAYRAKRTRIRVKQRVELESALEPELVELGKRIHDARAAGATVDDVAAVFGTKNRTFIYSALRAYAGSVKGTPQEQTIPAQDFEFRIVDNGVNQFGQVVKVEFPDGDWYTFGQNQHGDWEFPDEWFSESSSEKRELYKRVIFQIEG